MGIERLTVSGRDIAATLNPRPVVLITSCNATGRPNVMTAVWHTPLSHDPPLVGISITQTRYSHSLIQATGEFVINIAGQQMARAAEICGNRSGTTCDKFALANLRVEAARSVRAPALADALGYLECWVVNQVPCGDHTLFIGQVLNALARSDCFSSEWDWVHGDLLLCVQRDHWGRCIAVEKVK